MFYQWTWLVVHLPFYSAFRKIVSYEFMCVISSHEVILKNGTRKDADETAV